MRKRIELMEMPGGKGERDQEQSGGKNIRDSNDRRTELRGGTL